MGREPAVRVHLVRREREDDALDLSIGKAFERGEEEAGVLGRPLDVCVGRHDEDGAAPRG